jgi:hypothetical protein
MEHLSGIISFQPERGYRGRGGTLGMHITMVLAPLVQV